MTCLRLTILFVFLLAPLTTPCESAAKVDESFAVKLSLEDHLEKKLKSVLSEITGTDKIVAVVKADVRTAGRKTMSRRKGKMTSTKKDALILPGVPVKKEYGKGRTQSAELSLPSLPEGKFIIKRLDVTVFIDDAVAESVMETVRDIVMKIVGYNKKRGDLLEIKQLEFETKNSYLASFFYPPNLYRFILTLVGGFFLITAALFLIDPFKKFSAALRNVDWNIVRGVEPSGSRQGSNSETHNIFNVPSDQSAVREDHDDGDSPSAFSFIRERNLDDLSFLLKDQPAQDIAVVVNYLSSELASKLLGRFPVEKQVEIASSLGGEEMSPGRVHEMEEAIKKRLDYVIGGEHKLTSIMDMTDEDVRDKVFGVLENKNADLARRLRRKIKSFESVIRGLSVQGVQTLYRRLDPTLFAQIIRSSPDDVRDKVMESLSAGAVDRLKQEIELSIPLPPKRLRKEKRNVMLVVRRLIDEGFIEDIEG